MELLLELIFDFIFEGLAEGAMEGLESKKVSMPLRILCAVVLFAVLIGIGAFFVWLGLSDDSVATRIILGVVFAGLFGGLTWKVCKVFKKRRQ